MQQVESIFSPPSRPSIPDAEWEVGVRLMRGDTCLIQSEVPLRISDSWLTGTPKASSDRSGRMTEAGRNIAKWVDDQAQALARFEKAQKRAKKR